MGVGLLARLGTGIGASGERMLGVDLFALLSNLDTEVRIAGVDSFALFRALKGMCR